MLLVHGAGAVQVRTAVTDVPAYLRSLELYFLDFLFDLTHL